MKNRFSILFLCGHLFVRQLLAADYNGSVIDGNTYDCTAFSYDTGNFYNVTVDFSGDEATIYFNNGGHITITLDSEEIEDPNSISAYDYSKGVFWDLDVDGLE